MRYPARLTSRVMILGSTLLPTMMVGQTQEKAASDEDIYYMSPFEVTANAVDGYSTTETLAGTRLRTDLKDLANSITVVNAQFLKDTGATSSQDLLLYTTNTEVGGVYGNFSGTGGGQGYNEVGKLLRPNENTRVRGLDSADNTQNFFLTEAPWDGYNVERVEMQRGPNSILFGVGSPAGIVNASTKQATFKNAGSVETRIGSYGSVRGSVDVNRVILNDTLSVRVIGLFKNTQYQQDPAYERDSRIYGAVRYEPKLFGKDSSTSIRANFEHGDIKANRPRSLPPIDAITPWFKTGTSNGYPNMNKMTLNPLTTWDQYANYDGVDNNTYPWFKEAFLGRIMSSDVAQFYNADSSTPINSMMAMIGTNKGLNSTGGVDGTIGGIEFSRLWGISTYSNYAAGCVKGGKYYSDYSLSDSSIFDFYNKLIDGDNKEEWQKWINTNASISQTFFNNRVGFDVSNYYQNYEEGQYAFLSSGQYQISVDINTTLADGTANPNVGRAYVANSGYYGNSKNFIDRNSTRATAFVDLRSTDFFQESWVTRVLGHHLISGLYSHDLRLSDYRTFARWAEGTDYTDATGGNASLTGGLRNYDWVAYIGPSMTGSKYTSASGLNLSNVTADINPGKTVTAKYYNSTWTGGTNYGDTYTYYSYDKYGALVSTVGTQADNPANYKGWTTDTFSLLSAENGDINQLYTGITKTRNTIESVGATLQSYMLDDCLVVTYGYRKDRVKTLSGQAPKLANDVADYSYKLEENDGVSNANYASGISRTWGGVLHSPDFINRHLPFGLNLSVFYGEGENFKADAPRGDVFGNQIDNPKGNTKDYGFAVSMLDNRITLKTTWYKTSVANATLSASDAGFGSANLYYVWAIPYWGATHALAALDGIADTQLRQGNWGWPWNTYVNKGYSGAPAITTEDKQAIFAMVKDFFANIPVDDHFATEYGLGMTPSAMHAAASSATFTNQAGWSAFYAAVPGYGLNKETKVYDTVSGLGAGDGLGLQPAYAGSLKSFGSAPVASCDTTSKGIEWELTGRITDNWNVSVNVSKTKATITSVSPTLQSWIDSYTKFLEGDAGLIRLWGGDTFRTQWANHVVAPYSTLLAKIGSSASEVAPWRFNLVTNYTFSEGMLKGVNVGTAYRWEDKRILGYQYDETTDALAIDKPWKGPTSDHVDIWVGYTHALSDAVNWRVQLNVRNVGESAHLEPVYIQPDGTTGYSRIAEGTSWFLTNTFEF
jgi:outer membrane receptor protein involved in Fe transport